MKCESFLLFKRRIAMYSKETIAAISTGMSNSGIGIVRISGEEAFQVIDKIYKGKEVLSKVQ